jgi:nitrite reductase/ring-hydroxylating ferredoxin subunit
VSEWRTVDVPGTASEGELVARRVAGHALVLVYSGGSWHALDDECTHSGCALSEDGELIDGVLICNCHGAEFALESGAVIEGPADGPLETYAVRRVSEVAVQVLV